MAKFENARFNFKIKPEDSLFLESWNVLRENEDFQLKLNEIKKELSVENESYYYQHNILIKKEIKKATFSLLDVFGSTVNTVKINFFKSLFFGDNDEISIYDFTSGNKRRIEKSNYTAYQINMSQETTKFDVTNDSFSAKEDVWNNPASINLAENYSVF